MSINTKSLRRLSDATAAVQLERLEPRRLLAAEPYHWPLGSELNVNSYTPYAQSEPSMAMDADGDFVVAWTSQYQDGSSTGVYAQRYSVAGLPRGGEFRVNTYTTNSQFAPSAAMDADGDFVIAWNSYGQDGADPDVYAQRYNTAGLPQGGEFRVNTITLDTQQNPTVAMDADGDFVIAWESGYVGYEIDVDVYAQRFDAAGVRQGTEFLANSFTTGNQLKPSAAMGADGAFVVTWQSAPQDGSGYGIYARRYNATGVPQGTEFRVNTYTTSAQQNPSSTMDGDGDFVVTWQSYDQDGSGEGIFAQRYDAAGVTQGTEFRVNSHTTSTQWNPSAAIDDGGHFVIAWEGFGWDGVGIFAQRYDPEGAAEGTAFRANTHATGGQSAAAAAMDADGDFVVSWSGYRDGSFKGVLAQGFTTFGPTGAATIGDRVWNDSNANGIQDAGESGIAGAAIELFAAGGLSVGATTTNAAGQYSFPVLAGAAAFLQIITPAGFVTTHANRGANDDVDSDLVTGRTPIFTAGVAGTVNNSLDAGFSVPGSVSGVAFFDRSGDGVRNGGEEALASFLIFLDLDGVVVSSIHTDAAGRFLLGGLLGDTYRLGAFDREQWVEPALAPVVVIPGSDSPIDLPLRTSAHDSISSPQGGELRVNSHTTGNQVHPSVAMDANGNFVVAWTGAGQGDNSGVFAQRYNAAGVKQGTEFRVNTYTTNAQAGPSAAMDDDGDFVITWHSHSQDGSGFGIYAQRYNAAGVKQGTEFRVNTYTLSHQSDPAAAMDADGDFVVTWQGYVSDADIQARRYSAAGVPQGGEFRVNSTTTLREARPAVAMDADGDFVVTWAGAYVSYSGISAYQTYAQRYNAGGVAQGAELSASSGDFPSVAMDDAGNFAIASGTSEEFRSDVHVLRYSAAGVIQGDGFFVNTTDAFYPSLAMDADGDLLVTWTGSDGSSEGVDACRYNAAGMAQGSAFRVNTYTTGAQRNSAAAMDADGNFVITWWGIKSQDPDYGVSAQRYSVSQRPAITASMFVWQTAPQRIEFTFDQDVSASLSPADLVLRNLTTGMTIPSASIVLSWNAATRTARFSFPTLPNGGSLPDGRYRATLAAAGVSNAAGTTIAVDYALDFFVLAGDANRDGRVNLQDFNILAANFGQSLRDFSQGDFNYDGTVNLQDFNILASRFGQAPSSPQSRGESGVSDGRIEDAYEQRLAELI